MYTYFRFYWVRLFLRLLNKLAGLQHSSSLYDVSVSKIFSQEQLYARMSVSINSFLAFVVVILASIYKYSIEHTAEI